MIWPTREEWAVGERTVYGDMLDELTISHRLADYDFSQEQIDAAITELRDLWCAMGRELRTTTDEWFKHKRRSVNRAIKSLRNGEVPGPTKCDRHGIPTEILAPFDEKIEAARAAAVAELLDKIANWPIDDEAWARELERRAWCERRLSKTRVA